MNKPVAITVDHEEAAAVERNRLHSKRAMHYEQLERFSAKLAKEDAFNALSIQELKMTAERIRNHFKEFEMAEMKFEIHSFV